MTLIPRFPLIGCVSKGTFGYTEIERDYCDRIVDEVANK